MKEKKQYESKVKYGIAQPIHITGYGKIVVRERRVGNKPWHWYFKGQEFDNLDDAVDYVS